jgi:hypothetical protein
MQETKRNLLVVPGNLTRVKRRGAAAGYGYFRRSDLSKALRRLIVCSLLKSERRIEDGVLEIAPPESFIIFHPPTQLNLSWFWPYSSMALWGRRQECEVWHVSISMTMTWHVSPTLLNHLFGKLVLGLVSCNMVQSRLYKYLKRHEYPPDRGYDRMILESIARL